MLRWLVLFSVVCACANAFLVFNDDDDDDMQFSNDFFAVTKYKCFGAVVAENDDEDFETEFDICVFGVVAGLIVLIGAYPFLLQNSAEAVYPHRRQGQYLEHVPEFENPAFKIEQQQVARQSSLKKSLTNLFSPFVSKLQQGTERFADQLQRFGVAPEAEKEVLNQS